MGANGKKTDRPMTDEQETLFTETLWGLDTMVDDLKGEQEANGGRLPSREFSIAMTKLEEAQMWIERGFSEMGYKVPEPPSDEDDDEGDDEGDSDEDDDGDDESEEDTSDNEDEDE